MADADAVAEDFREFAAEAEGLLETLCYKTARALSSHFKKSGDPIRRAKVDYKLGYYQKLRDQFLITAATDLITIVTPALIANSGHGPAAADNPACQSSHPLSLFEKSAFRRA